MEKDPEQTSTLATMYEAEKTADDARRSRHNYGCPYSDNSEDLGDDFVDAVDDFKSDDR